MNENPVPVMPPMLAAAVTREPKTKADKKMHSMRLASVLQELSTAANDPSNGEEVGKTAAATMAMTILRNMPLIIWALKTAGK